MHSKMIQLFLFSQDDGLLSNNINLLSTGDDGSIYIGTNNGLNRYFPETKGYFHILKEMDLQELKQNQMQFLKDRQVIYGLVLQMEQPN